jgi:hypothetical protein
LSSVFNGDNANTVINNHINNTIDLRFLTHPNDAIRYAYFVFSNNQFIQESKKFRIKLLEELIDNGTVQLAFNCDYFNNQITATDAVGTAIADSKHISDIDNLYERINNQLTDIFINRIMAPNSCNQNSNPARYIFDVSFEHITKNQGVQLPQSLVHAPESLTYIVAPHQIVFKNELYIGTDIKVGFDINVKGIRRKLITNMFDNGKRVYIKVPTSLYMRYLITQKLGYNSTFYKSSRNKYIANDQLGIAQLSIDDNDNLGLFRPGIDMLNIDAITVIPPESSIDRPLFGIDPLNPDSPLNAHIQNEINSEISNRLKMLFNNSKSLQKFLRTNNSKITDLNNVEKPLSDRDLAGCNNVTVCVSQISHENVKYHIYNPLLKSHLDTRLFSSLVRINSNPNVLGSGAN